MASLDPAFIEAKQKEEEQALKAKKLLEDTWQEKLENYEQEYANQADFEKLLEQKYMQVLGEMNFDLTQAWQASTNLEEQLVHGEIRS